MEKEILEILKEIQKDNKEMKAEIKEINNKLDGVVEEVTKANRIEKC